VNFYILFAHKDITIKNELIIVFSIIVHGFIAINYAISIVDFLNGFYLSIFLIQLSNLNRLHQTTGKFFNVGLLFGSAILININFIIFFPVVFLSLNVFGKNGFKDLGGLIVGFCAPIYILFTIVYVTDSMHLIHKMLESIAMFRFQLATNWYLVPIGITVLNGLASFPHISNQNITSRKLFTILFGVFIVVVLASVNIVFNQSKFLLTLLTVGAIYMSMFIINDQNKRIKNLIIILGILWAIIDTFVLR
jgi:hypothetical protein